MGDLDRFVGVGVDEYEDAGLGLDYAVAEVQAVAQQLSPHFVGAPLINLTANQIRDELDTLPNSRPGVLVLLWLSHGR